MKILKNLLSLALGISIGLCLVAFTATPTPTALVQGSTFTNPYCPYTPPACPFFDPCPEGSHVDRACADACCAAYTSALTSLYAGACTSFNGFVWQFDEDNEQMVDDYDNCIAHGGTPQICMDILMAASRASLARFRASARDLALKVAQGEQDALDAYFACLLACECVEDPPTPQ